jgi:CopG family nickel-responsive transcriptional regulator
MEQLERIGISVESKLLKQFDSLIEKQGYQSRSEAVRDLIRAQLSNEKIADPNADAVAAVVLVYDHHASKLTEKLITLQHSHILDVISSLHVHLDKHDCLEVVVLKGKISQINKVGENILSIKGVKLGRVNLVAT